MANYYIGGVGRVNAFIRKNGKLEHYFDANTLTTSGIEVSTSLEEIRGGEGAGLIAQFAHTSVFNLNMTDALFDMKYIAAQVGDIGEKEQLKAVPGFYSENITANASGEASLEKRAIGLFDESQWCQQQSGDIVAWATDCDNKVIKCNVNADGTKVTGLKPSTEYCITYPYEREAAEQVVVKSMFYPAEISLILTAKLFSGNACKPSNGQPVGEIVIEIPRFQLNGTVNLSMEMSSPSTFELSGKALVSGCNCSEGGSYYARISRVEIDNGKRFDGYTALVALDEGAYKVGEKLYVYATGANKKPIRLYRDEYKAYIGTYSEKDEYKYVNASGEMVLAGADVILELVSDKNVKGTITIVANA